MIKIMQIVNCECCGQTIQVPMGSKEDGWYCESCIDYMDDGE